ncbi:hypothetical protein FOQG_02375 [Fusarium oxysporum f. sp. raphani 54005]|uniref:Uncharacterized protein n=2 Tax=Fusarium oxysporum TaxID=5507 RepID=X0D1N0_FUSOX|nr:hypothetical protein FOVG_07420 [Fusarium oxysporum f. sp. pisi HDV247]EXK97029.1 hypothetical protein FOQG_02375 [Fusarium oxysporum f. sp. raphani 54005]
MGVKKLEVGEATAYYRSTELKGQRRSGRENGIGVGEEFKLSLKSSGVKSNSKNKKSKQATNRKTRLGRILNRRNLIKAEGRWRVWGANSRQWQWAVGRGHSGPPPEAEEFCPSLPVQ